MKREKTEDIWSFISVARIILLFADDFYSMEIIVQSSGFFLSPSLFSPSIDFAIKTDWTKELILTVEHQFVGHLIHWINSWRWMFFHSLSLSRTYVSVLFNIFEKAFHTQTFFLPLRSLPMSINQIEHVRHLCSIGFPSISSWIHLEWINANSWMSWAFVSFWSSW